VRTESVAPGCVRLEVQDDGPGIPESLQRRIFDPFFTTKPPGKGTGLGLAIVNAFVRHHGGTIALHSHAGEGANFVVELPAAEKQPEHAQSENKSVALESSIATGSPEAANGLQFKEKGRRVLVVEDEPTVANLIQDVLRDQGMETAVFSNAGQAPEAAQDSCYDLAICDVHMPEMDGPLFFSALRQANSPLQERILFVTGDEVAQRTSEFLAEHQLPYVTKPFRIEELCAAVRKMLGGQQQSAEPLSVDL
jgi:CheY-like chemotaxis protein